MKKACTSQTGQNPSSEKRKWNPNPTPPQEAVCNGYLRGNGEKKKTYSSVKWHWYKQNFWVISIPWSSLPRQNGLKFVFVCLFLSHLIWTFLF